VIAAVLLFAALVIPPAPTAHVNDYAGVLSAAESQALDRNLTEREASTGAQMVVAIFPSLEGESLEDYSIRLAQQWRIGQKKLDDGVILLVFIKDRKVRLEVGYGLEPVVTDAVAAQIVRERIAPRFREGRYAAGIEAAVAGVFERIGAGAGPGKRPAPTSGPSLPVIGFLAVLGVIAFILLHEMFSRQRVARRNAYTAGSGGWEAPVIMSMPWWIGRGRGGGGGGFGGGFGGGGGGGFSGGGGSFGGGGASGDW
jgi:uncharacterized protein